MHINLTSTSSKLFSFSPLFSVGNGLTPYLSPLPQNALLKEEFEDIQLLNFRLEPNQEPFEDLEPNGPHIENTQAPGFKSQQFLENCSLNYSEAKEHEMDQSQDYRNKTVSSLVNANKSRVQLMIEFLVVNSEKKDEVYQQQIKALIGNSEQNKELYGILTKKFKKLKKTKEEMTKYCMRKSFKFIADRMKKDKIPNKDVDTCMKVYFYKTNNSQNFTIPFKKNSTEKTMNGNFLKRVFSSGYFIQDYREFLKQFKELIEEDNKRKIKYLTDLIEEYLISDNIKKVESIKRLPWTQQTLEETFRLGTSLMSYAEPTDSIKNAAELV